GERGLPHIQKDLNSSFSDLQRVVDAYALMLASLLLTAGSLGDILGRRLVFAGGVALFSAASLTCALATTPLFLNLARGAQGIGGAAMFATSLALIAQFRLFPGGGLAVTGLALPLMRRLALRLRRARLRPAESPALLRVSWGGAAGLGLPTPPLASTAVAVVEPRMSGMGSEINNTFRQVGIATGIAAVGSALVRRRDFA